MMVEYTAPVFWLFFLMIGISVFLMRLRHPDLSRPFRVPLYPLTPIAFCAICTFMLYASLAFTGRGSWVGVCVLLSGIPLVILQKKRKAADKIIIKLSDYSNDRGENDAKIDGLWRVGKLCRSEIQSFTFAGKTGFCLLIAIICLFLPR